MSNRARKMVNFLESQCGWDIIDVGEMKQCTNCKSTYFRNDYNFCPECGNRLMVENGNDNALDQVEEGFKIALGEK